MHLILFTRIVLLEIPQLFKGSECSNIAVKMASHRDIFLDLQLSTSVRTFSGSFLGMLRFRILHS